MDFHLDRRLRLHTNPEHKSLYRWAIQEIDAQGQQIGQDQIPWVWTLNFTAIFLNSTLRTRIVALDQPDRVF